MVHELLCGLKWFGALVKQEVVVMVPYSWERSLQLLLCYYI